LRRPQPSQSHPAVARALCTKPRRRTHPCHRVVREDGDLAGYRWGLKRKRALLAKETSSAHERSVWIGAAHAHFLPTRRDRAFFKSSGVIAIRTLTSALKVRNHGSAKRGSSTVSQVNDGDGAAFAILLGKKIASGLSASKILANLLAGFALRTSELNGSCGIVISKKAFSW